MTCLMPFLVKNASNFWPVNPVALSVMIVSGRPNFANTVHNSSMTTFDIVDDVHTASIHFEFLSVY